ncbi:MAG: hypothetical protein QXT34_01490 [Candidatus Aenigmatarchaeota archaeon]
MNTLSLIIILALIGITMFLSFQNMLFAISRDVKEKIIESRIKNFVDIIETVSKISSDYFYLEYFIDQSDLKIENNTLKIKVDDKTYSFLLHSKVENVEINKASRYCIFKDRNIIKIFNCRDAMPINDGICEIRECRLNSEDCKGPNIACINDGICNTYIGENCENSADCAEKNNEKVCCPMDPSSNEKGYTARKNLKKGEECFCDNQCSGNLKCNPVASNFKEYSRACCESGKYWNGIDCIEEKSRLRILFIPVNWNRDMQSFRRAAEEQFDFFVRNIPLSACPEKVKSIIVEKNCRFKIECDNRGLRNNLMEIKRCADSTGETYDYVVGLVEGSICGAGGYSMSMKVVVASALSREITTHELGHELGLNDEYIDACRCGSGLVNPNSNCLKSYLGGDDPFGPYTREYCSEKGTKCPTEYTITCLGNKNKFGGRDIMSFANAPGPRAFAEESWRYLSSLSILKC